MTPLTWVSGGFRAEVLAARLRSEGIDARLRFFETRGPPPGARDRN